MIIRKPYAFLIKNFRKIHIFLLLLCCYVYYKNMQTRSFVSEFLQLGTYDSYNEPITDYASPLAIISLLMIIVLSCNIPYGIFFYVKSFNFSLLFYIFLIVCGTLYGKGVFYEV